MDLAFRLMLDGLQLVILLGFPGFSIVLILPRPPETVVRMLVYAVSTSLVYLTVLSALLLHLGVFSLVGLLISATLPAMLVIARWRHSWARLRRVRLSTRTLVPSLLVGGVVLILVLATPMWNFLLAPNMDAGNYELYGNHFWKTGSFYLDGRELLEQGASPDWLASHNTWNIDPDSGLGKPSYLPGYPILLGIFKANFDSAVASPLVNALLASLSAILMVLIGLQLVRAPFVVASLTLALCITPIFFYYGKQFMSEQLGLLGVLLIVYALLEVRGPISDDRDKASLHTATLGVSVGISLGLLSRLDFFALLPVLIVGLVILEFDAWSRDDRSMSSSFFIWSALAAFGSSAIVAFLGHSGYLAHGQPEALADVVSPNSFLVLYGLATGIAISMVGMVRPVLRRMARPGRKVAITRLGQILAALLAGLWVLFVLWNLFVRPFGFGPSSEPHDAENLLRLFSVTSAVLLGAMLLLSPFTLILRKYERGIAVMLIAGFGLALYSSRHSSPDIWWMRRYLHYFMPLTLIVLAGMIDQMRKRLFPANTGFLSAAGAVLLVVASVQAWLIRPLFVMEMNPDVPARMAQLIRDIPDESLVIVLQGPSVVRGLANTYRSLSGETVLVDVAPEEIRTATALAAPGQSVVILSPSQLTEEVVETLELEQEPNVAVIERQWSNWLDDIYANPRPSKAYNYFIYQRPPLDQD